MEIRLPPGELDRARQEGRLVGIDPYRTTGIIDTAAQRTCIQANIVDKLLLDPISHRPLHSRSGLSGSAIYDVTLQPAWRLEHRPDPIPVSAYVVQEVLGTPEVLIGLDVLRRGKLILLGLENRYKLNLPRTIHPN